MRYVVRIHFLDGAIHGTGFVVAPGLILTNAHVVAGQQEVLVASSSRLEDASAALVLAASRPPDIGDGDSALWPFPDLAVLASDAFAAWPCPLLDEQQPSGRVDCHTWGYALREEGVAPVGSAFALRFTGGDGDGWLSLKGDTVRPGLSGSPLLCPERGAIVGVVGVTRDANAAVGGYASPIAALTAPAAPDGLREIGRGILAENRAAVLRSRRTWHAVWDFPAVDIGLDQPWAEFVRGPNSLPSQMLVAEHMVVPYLFRKKQLEESIRWCEAPTVRAMAHLAASGGRGKTRYAVELCRAMIERGWVAGLLASETPAICELPLPRLVVIDYAEAAGGLVRFIAALSASATDLAPVRILLLTRTKIGNADVLGGLSRYAPLQQIADDALNPDAATDTIDEKDRPAFYSTAVERFAKAWGVALVDAPSPEPDLCAPEYGAPLEILLEALLFVLRREAAADPSAAPLLGRVLAHEMSYWETTNPELSPEVHRRCVALATLAGADTEAAAEALLTLVPELETAAARRRAQRWLAALYAGDGVINPLRPDRLGEYLVGEVLSELGEDATQLIVQILTIGTQFQVVRCLEVLRRAGAADQGVALVARRAVDMRLSGLVQRAAERVAESYDLATALAAILTERRLAS